MPDYSHLCGRIEDPREVDKFLAVSANPYMSGLNQAICGSGKGKKSNNVGIVRYVLGGRFPILVQEITDCVAFGLAGAISCLQCIRKFQGKYEEFGGFICTEDIYGGSRILIGRGQLGRGGGSVGIWAAEYAKIYGTLARKKYGNIDLSKYSASRASNWGMTGVPSELLPYAEEHQVKTYTQIRTWEEFRDSIYNGFPVTVASQRGFSGRRDAQGFLSGKANWPHQVYFLDVQDGERPGGLLVNSWPEDWVQGAEREDTPHGTGWVDAEIIVRDMLSQNDSFCYSDYEGYPAQDLDTDISKLAEDKLKDYK